MKMTILLLNIAFIGVLVWVFCFLIPGRSKSDLEKRADIVNHGKYTIGNTLRSKFIDKNFLLTDHQFLYLLGLLH